MNNTLTLDLAAPRLETRTLTVSPANAAQQRATMAVAGWHFHYDVKCADGRLKLTFSRLKLSAAEREA